MPRRRVEPVPEFEDDVLMDFVSPSTRCVTGAEMLLEELERHDPDPEERCGLLADRYEIYALAIPRCANLALVVSLDLRGDRSLPCRVHGLLPGRGSACGPGREKAARHFNLINPSWEPADG